jgi:hypothetical protein
MYFGSESVCFGNSSRRNAALSRRTCLSPKGELCGCSGMSHETVKTDRPSGRNASLPPDIEKELF